VERQVEQKDRSPWLPRWGSRRARNYEAYGELATGKRATENPGGDTFYWRFLEFGTSSISPRPFMRPALAENTSEATNIFVNEYEKVLNRVTRRRINRKGR